MQLSNKKTIQLAVTLGQTVKELRESTDGLTLNRLANEYELYKGTLSKIERGQHNCQFITIWQLSEALGIKCSELVKRLEEKQGDDFSLIDE